jgi:DnaJ domain
VETVAVLIMIVGGVAIAMFVFGAAAIARGEAGRVDDLRRAAPRPDEIAASLLFQVFTAGGASAEDALRDVRRSAGLAGRVTRSIDVANWGDAYAQVSSPAQRQALLETAVRLVAARHRQIPLLQYIGLLDLSFALGFQTDALARLRVKYGFDYIDHAQDARPRDADRAARKTLFARAEGDREQWLALLEIDGTASRQTIISAYRRLAAQNHPDRFHGQSVDVQSAAAARFIEITRAYEALLSLCRD